MSRPLTGIDAMMQEARHTAWNRGYDRPDERCPYDDHAKLGAWLDGSSCALRDRREGLAPRWWEAKPGPSDPYRRVA